MHKIIIILVLFGLSTLVVANDTQESKSEKYEYFKKLSNDDDWLTGIWVYESDSAMTLYTLFEKTENGYSVKNFYPRYSVTWWTGKVKKNKNKVSTWNYEIIDGRLQLTNKPTDIETYKNGKLLSSKIDEYYNTRYPVKDENEFRYLSGVSFITGKKFLETKLKNNLYLKKSIPRNEVLLNSKTLRSDGDIKTFYIEESQITELDEYYLAGVTLGWPPRSGYCGASEDTGYYWVHLNSSEGKWKIVDEWILTKNICSSNQSIDFEKQDNGRIIFHVKEDNDGPMRDVDCYEISLKTLSSKPTSCKMYTLTTKNFIVKIKNDCKKDNFTCDNFTYHGTSRKTGKSINLKGYAMKSLCDDVAMCPSQGYEFKNGNITYQVLKSGFLKVIKGRNKILLSEEGSWSN